MKKRIFQTLIVATLVIALCVGIFAGCTKTTESSVSVDTGVVTDLEVVNGKVASAVSIEEGGEVLSNENLIGEQIEDAVEQIVDESATEGNITEGEDVSIGVSGEDKQQIEKDIADRMKGVFERHKFNKKDFCKIDLAELEAKAEEWGVSIGRARIITKIVELDETAVAEDLIAKEREELISTLRDLMPSKIESDKGHCKMEEGKELTDEQKAAIEERIERMHDRKAEWEAKRAEFEEKLQERKDAYIAEYGEIINEYKSLKELAEKLYFEELGEEEVASIKQQMQEKVLTLQELINEKLEKDVILTIEFNESRCCIYYEFEIEQVEEVEQVG